MFHRLLFLLKRLNERLWVRPLLFCLLSVAAAIVASTADGFRVQFSLPTIASESIETLLSITAGSMLVIATLAVTSMVSAYASASSTATPRSFSLLVADDLSQNALSTFLGAFIFSFVALVALKNDFYGSNGLLVLFALTVAVLAFVVVTFVRWVDWIARLGRIGTTIEKVEAAGVAAFRRRCQTPRLGAGLRYDLRGRARRVYADSIGYVQQVNAEQLQEYAARTDSKIHVDAVPGTFVGPARPLALVEESDSQSNAFDESVVRAAFEVGDSRVYDDDPRFALVALSEIASRALSPAVNDPGTAITIFGSYLRLFDLFAQHADGNEAAGVQFDRVFLPDIAAADMLDDAFGAVARDGAGIVEVQIRLQKALEGIGAMQHQKLGSAARQQSQIALERAKAALTLDRDVDRVIEAATWAGTDNLAPYVGHFRDEHEQETPISS